MGEDIGLGLDDHFAEDLMRVVEGFQDEEMQEQGEEILADA